MNSVKLLAIFFVLFILIILLVLAHLHYRTQHHPLQTVFLTGSVPAPLPDGLYKGTVDGKQTSWVGKKFNQNQNNGINVFRDNNGINTKDIYPFKTYVGYGGADKKLRVFKIDYDVLGNPLWLRCIVDEIVEIRPGHYLGKLEVRILPYFSLALGYFELDHETP
jgi:hypothetical protein